MKITKKKLKSIIVEEVMADPELLRSIRQLTDSIEELDVSVDYLTSTFTGEDPFSLGALQKGLGRIAKPSKKAQIDEEQYGEGSMARGQLGRTAELAIMIQQMVDDNSDLEEWVESKITKANDYLSTVLNYMRGDQLSENELDEILSNRSDVGDYIEDFRTSKAPQFKGKSKEKRREMAISAALDAQDKRNKKKGKK